MQTPLKLGVMNVTIFWKGKKKSCIYFCEIKKKY